MEGEVVRVWALMGHRCSFTWVVLLASLTTAFAAAQPAVDPATASQLITDFTKDIPAGDGANACFTLRFKAIRPLPGWTDGGDVFVQLQRVAGAWANRGHTAAADYNQRSENTVAIDDVAWDGKVLKGKLRVTIKPDAPRPRVAGFPTPADEFAIDFSVERQANQYLAWQPEPQAFMPPWRRDEPTYGGEILTGRFTAIRAGEKTEGVVDGGVQPNETETHFGTTGTLELQRADGGGAAITARMSPKRVASCQAIASRRFAPKQDWSGWDALRLTVASSTRRDDVAVAVALRAGDGRWQQVTSAAYLLGSESQFIVRLADFDVDPRAITGIAIGVDNADGVGDVTFVVRKIELVQTGAAKPSARTRSRIVIDPATAWSINGTSRVPKGLFGFHDVGESKPRAPKAGELPEEAYLQAIRPGFLRPLAHVGMGGTKPLTDAEVREHLSNRPAHREGVLLNRAKAADAVDGVLWTHTFDLWARPAWMDEPIEKTVTGAQAFYRNLAADAYVPGDEDNLLRSFEVLNEPFMWARHINMGKLNPAGKKAWTDPTQYGYVPAKLGADVWSSIFLAASKGAKGVNPNVRLGGPSCPEFAMDDYGMFETYVAPILDQCHDQLDFLTEHHYGGNPRTFAAGYEVVTAWCDVKFNRRIPVYVTETNDLGASSAGKASYNIEDILTCVRQSPDKVKGRALHALWDGYLNDEGELHAYTLLSPLRGTLVSATSDDDDVTTVATTPAEGTLVIVAHNRSQTTKTIDLAGAGEMTLEESMLLLATSTGPELELKDTEGQKIPPAANGRTKLQPVRVGADGTFALPARSAIRWTFSKAQYQPAQTRITEQHFTDALLTRVKPNEPVSANLVWRPKRPEKIVAARLRVLTRDVNRGEAVAVIGGKEILLPPSSSNEGQVIVQDVPIDPSLLTDPMRIEFRCTDPARQNGFRIYAASVCVDR